jgi:hypothetical protein
MHSWPVLRYDCSVCPEGLRKTTETLVYDNRSPDQDFKPGLLEHKAEVLHHFWLSTA